MLQGNLVLNTARVLSLASLASFGFSLTQDCYYVERDEEGANGALLLLIGWIGLFEGEYVWLANLFWLVTWIWVLTSKSSTRFVGLSACPAMSSAVGLAISLSFCFQSTTLCGRGPIGIESTIAHYGIGYYFWVSSFILQLVTTILATCSLKLEVIPVA